MLDSVTCNTIMVQKIQIKYKHELIVSASNQGRQYVVTLYCDSEVAVNYCLDEFLKLSCPSFISIMTYHRILDCSYPNITFWQ
jgi:hypothetical protein